MYTKNLLVKEMYASIGATDFIKELFEKGLEMGNDRLAVSAMEELLRREDTDLIHKCLNEAFAKEQMVQGSSLVTLIASSLLDGARGVDPVLCSYGKGLLRGEFMGPQEWVRTHADRLNGYSSSKDKRPNAWAPGQAWCDTPVDDGK